MFEFPDTIILRHRKENLKKCSLRGLETREDFLFFTYPKGILPDLSGHILLAVNAPPLTLDDKKSGLFLIDATWRYAEIMGRTVSCPVKRSIPPHYRTAYPRRQAVEEGLASIEALYLAYSILERDTQGLLDSYHWKEKFLELNHLRVS